MSNHFWIRDVMADLEVYALSNDVPPEVAAAISQASKVAKANFPLDPKKSENWLNLLTNMIEAHPL